MVQSFKYRKLVNGRRVIYTHVYNETQNSVYTNLKMTLSSAVSTVGPCVIPQEKITYKLSETKNCLKSLKKSQNLDVP